MPEEKHVYLRYKAVGSNKDYQLHLVPSGHLWVVNFVYGKHGGTLKPDTKTPKPLPFEEAEKEFTKALKKQMAKGYTTDPSGAAYVATDKEGRIAGVNPQLLNFIEEEETLKYIKDNSFVMQEKKDGRRIMVRGDGKGTVEAINRKGLVVGFPENVKDALKDVPAKFILDGEMVGETYYVFDILEYSSEDYRPKGYLERSIALEAFVKKLGAQGAVVMLPCYLDTEEKLDAFGQLEMAGAEGVVFKHIDAPYTAGRPNSHGPQTKYKWYATAVCIVMRQNGNKRSVALGVRSTAPETGTTGLREIGSVTIPANYNIPEPNQYVEIRYLYAYPGGSLYQPIYQGVREDVEDADDYETFKFKQGATDPEDES